MKALKPNKNRAKIAIYLIWAVLFFQFLDFLFNINYYLSFKESINGNLNIDRLYKIITLSQITNIIYLIIYIISSIYFIMWFRRAYYNLVICIKTTKYHDSWAAGAWFVPFINLWRPFSMMRELYRETKLYLSKHSVESPKLNGAFLGIWWILFIGNEFIARIIKRLQETTEDIHMLMDLSLLSAFIFIAHIILAIITVRIIKDYSFAEEQLFQLEKNKTKGEQDKTLIETNKML